MRTAATDPAARATATLLSFLKTADADAAPTFARQIADEVGLGLAELGRRLRTQLSFHFLASTGLDAAVPRVAPAPAAPDALVLVETAEGQQVMSLRSWLDQHCDDVDDCRVLLAAPIGDTVEIAGTTLTRLGVL